MLITLIGIGNTILLSSIEDLMIRLYYMLRAFVILGYIYYNRYVCMYMYIYFYLFIFTILLSYFTTL